MVPAVRTHTAMERVSAHGTSAGVFLAAPTHIGMDTLLGSTSWDWSPAGSGGRLAAAWVNLAGGILCISIYFWCGEGLSFRNCQVLAAAEKLIRAYDVFWIIMADWQVQPDVLQASVWPLRLKGTIAAPTDGIGTCTSRGVGSVLDYFLVDDRLISVGYAIATDHFANTTPHKPVTLELRGKPRAQTITRLKVPRPIGVAIPIGCEREPPAWPRPDMASCSQENVTKWWSGFVAAAEPHLLATRDFVGRMAQPYLGRGEVPKTVTVPLLPRKPRNEPRARPETHAWRWLARRLGILGSLMVHACHPQVPAGTSAQLTHTLCLLKTAKYKLRILDAVADQVFFWVDMLNTDTLLCDDGFTWVQALLATAHHQAKIYEHEDSVKNDADYKQFLRNASVGNAAGLHRVSKLRSPWQPEAGAQLGDLAEPDAAVESHLLGWEIVWRVHDDVAQGAPRPWLLPLEEAGLPRPSDDRLVAVTAAYKEGTGIGSDRIHPRHVGQLPHDARECYIDFLVCLEEFLILPEHHQLLQYWLTPKPDSPGKRPLCLLPTMVRTWEAVRKPVLQQWIQSTAMRRYNWACVGRSAEGAAWSHLLKQEAADGEEIAPHPLLHVSGSALLDVVKAYEHLTLDRVWAHGVRWNFPRVLLRVVIFICSLPRVIVLNGACSRAVQTICAICAGSVFSNTMLTLVLLDTLDAADERWPYADLKLYVDDLVVQVAGPLWYVQDTLCDIFGFIVDSFEKALELPISRGRPGQPGGKTVVFATHTALERAIAPFFKSFGVAITNCTKYVGVDLVKGNRKKGCIRPVQQRRRATMMARSKILFRYKIDGAATHKVALRGLVPAVAYGARCVGVPTPLLNRIRTDVAKHLPGKATMRSTTIRLAIADQEQAGKIGIAPAQAWAEAVWDGTDKPGDLAAAWKAMMTRAAMRGDGHTWQVAVQPAASCAATLERLGWQFPAPTAFTMHDGKVLDLKAVCPTDVVATLRRRAEDVIWLDWTSRPEYRALAPRPFIEPLRELSRRRNVQGWTLHHSRLLNCLAADGHYTQDRWHRMGLADDSKCLECGAEASGVHRCYRCQAGRAIRDELPRTYQHMGEAAPDHDLLWERGLVADPCVGKFVPVLEQRHNAVAEAIDDQDKVTACTDGSRLSRRFGSTRVGWAVVTIDPKTGSSITIDFGSIPIYLEVQCRILRAELWAVYRALSAADYRHITLYCDNGTVCAGIQAGRKACCHAKKSHADVWVLIWNKIEDIGVDRVVVVKIKAHMSQAAILLLSSDQQALHKGNALADMWAKEGAELNGHDLGRDICAQNLTAKIKGIMDYNVRFAIAAEEVVHDAVTDVPHKPRGPFWARTKPLPHRAHRFVSSGLTWECLRCGRKAATAKLRNAAQKEVCKGGVALLLAQDVVPPGESTPANFHGHTIFTSGPIYWCDLCGAYAQVRAKRLAQTCLRHPSTPGMENNRAQLRKGLHPVRRREYLGPPLPLRGQAWAEFLATVSEALSASHPPSTSSTAPTLTPAATTAARPQTVVEEVQEDTRAQSVAGAPGVAASARPAGPAPHFYFIDESSDEEPYPRPAPDQLENAEEARVAAMPDRPRRPADDQEPHGAPSTKRPTVMKNVEETVAGENLRRAGATRPADPVEPSGGPRKRRLTVKTPAEHTLYNQF